MVGVPVSTVRGWLRRFAANAEAVRVWFSVMAHDLGPLLAPILPTPAGVAPPGAGGAGGGPAPAGGGGAGAGGGGGGAGVPAGNTNPSGGHSPAAYAPTGPRQRAADGRRLLPGPPRAPVAGRPNGRAVR